MAAFAHGGVAAGLVHDFKYRGIGLIADLAVEQLRPRLAPGLSYCPVPRVWSRYVRFGVDPAMELAQRLALATGGRVVLALVRPIHSSRRAGARTRGAPPRFGVREAGGRLVLVDDVLTTGSTVSTAAAAVGRARAHLVVTITSVPKSPDRNWRNPVSSP